LCKFLCRASTWHYSQHIQKPGHDHMYIWNHNRSRLKGFQFFLQQLSLKSRVMLHKSCRVTHMETNKIGFTFFCFSVILYDFSKFWPKHIKGKESNCKGVPEKFWIFTEMPLGTKSLTAMPSTAWRARRRRGRARGGQQMAPTRDWAHQESIRVLGSTGGVAGEWRRRVHGGVAAVARIPVGLGVVLSNVLRWELLGNLGERLEGLDGSGSKRRGELGEVAAMAATKLGCWGGSSAR
jgi:hypothetical protein